MPLRSSAASDYDPQGDGQEYPSATQHAIDGQRPTNWETETYQSGVWPGGKDGVGIYLDAGDPIPGRRLDLVTSTPGFEAAVYGAPNGVPGTIDGWTKLSSTKKVGEDRALRPRHRPAALPLLPRLDHRRSRRAARPASRSSASSAEAAGGSRPQTPGYDLAGGRCGGSFTAAVNPPSPAAAPA